MELEKNGLLTNHLILILKLLPEQPGVYQFYNLDNRIIYVGKAKNLRKRVNSYFVKVHDNKKTNILVRNIVDIKHIVVESEEDALLLENNLIKKYQPRYNILLKDDKSFPWICVKNEKFPRVFYTRNLNRDGSNYFGPYTSIVMVKTILETIIRLFQIRNCSLNLTKENIVKSKYKVCLEYQIGNCKGPCEGYQSEENYSESIIQIKEILKGNLFSVQNYLKFQMNKFSDEYKYEEALNFKNKLKILDSYKSKSTIVSSSITNLDVFSFVEDTNFGYINYLRVIDGAIVQAHTIEIKKRLDESKEELLIYAIGEIRQRFNQSTKEIIVPFFIDIQLNNIRVVVPQIGDKRKLLELSERNAKIYKLDKDKNLSLKLPKFKMQEQLLRIQSDLKLLELPFIIECFDNSNIQGTNPVASCVVFKDCKPAKNLYRHYNIKTVNGPNDFASMEEIIMRRYTRLIKDEIELPQLIVIDGGKGQLSAAKKSLESIGLNGKIAIIGIAKRLEEIIFPDDPTPLYLDKRSETLRLLQHIRNEAHRFGINFHRSKRSNDFLISEMEQVIGIGDKSIQTIFRKFKSIKRLRDISKDELVLAIGKNKGEKIFNYLHSDLSKTSQNKIF